MTSEQSAGGLFQSQYVCLGCGKKHSTLDSLADCAESHGRITPKPTTLTNRT